MTSVPKLMSIQDELEILRQLAGWEEGIETGEGFDMDAVFSEVEKLLTVVTH